MDERILEGIRELISSKTGLRIRTQDGEALNRVISERMRSRAMTSPSAYYGLLSGDTSESRCEEKNLIELLTMGESYFLRDHGQFTLLKTTILPELIGRRKNERRLGVLSAGCAGGEEAYSVAILIDELIPDRTGWDILILATDIKEEFIEKARRGVYGEWSLRMVAPGIVEKYFRRNKNLFELDERIKAMVTFRQLDLRSDGFPSHEVVLRGMDLILCRNVFIYYRRKAVRTIVAKLKDALVAGGYLMTGHGELYSVITGGLRPLVFPESVIYERVKEVPPQPPISLRKEVDFEGGGVPPPPCRRPAPARPVTVAEVEKPPKTPSIAEAESLFKIGAYRETIERGKAVLAGDPANFRAVYLIGSAHANLGEHKEAKTFLKKALEKNDLAPEPYYLLAQIAQEEGDMEDAEDNLRKVIYINPLSIHAYLELASLYEDAGDIAMTQKMRRSAVDALKALPGDAPVAPYEGMRARELIERIKKLT
ncbi:MAG: hypothetical protein HY883_00930 [Deltaproteobacteria bacterium]|nr:hypothetical protein [Deltaproteobacteria bacterium]